MDELILFFVVVFLVVALIFGIGFAVYEYQVNVGCANIIHVYEKDNLIYEGKSYFALINSGGMTTTITIYKSRFPFDVIKEIISSKDIVVK